MQSRNRRSEAAWPSLIQQQVESGLSAAEFCRQHRLNQPYFAHSKRALHDRKKALAPSNPFIEVQANHSGNEVTATAILLQYREAQLLLPVGGDVRALAQLMKLL